MKKILYLTLAFSVSVIGCMPAPQAQQKFEGGVNVSLFQRIYPTPEIRRKLYGIKPYNVDCPKYIKVWVGSYSDKKGNFHAAHWEWLKIKDCKPETNF
jgi:hypothetical protein